MRQNMEELQATQEEAARQGEKLASFTSAVNHTLIRAEYNTVWNTHLCQHQISFQAWIPQNSEVEASIFQPLLIRRIRSGLISIWQGCQAAGDISKET